MVSLDSNLVFRRPPYLRRDEIKAIVALEHEPADVVGAAAAGDEIVFQAVGDSAGLGIDSVGAEIGGIAFKGGCFFFGCRGEQSFCKRRKGLRSALSTIWTDMWPAGSYMMRPVGRS